MNEPEMPDWMIERLADESLPDSYWPAVAGLADMGREGGRGDAWRCPDAEDGERLCAGCVLCDGERLRAWRAFNQPEG